MPVGNRTVLNILTYAIVGVEEWKVSSVGLG